MFNLGMNQNAQAPQQNPTQNNRFYPATQSLNKNADGFVVSINMTQNDIVKSRFESRLEWIKQGRPQAARPTGMPTASFGQQAQQAPGQFLTGGLGQPGSQNKFNQQPSTSLFPSTQQGGLFQAPQQPIGGLMGGPTANTQQPSLFSLGGTQNAQPGMTQQTPGMFGQQGGQSQIGGLSGGIQQNTGLFGQTAPQQLGGALGQIGQQQQFTPPVSNFGINQPPLLGQQTGLFTPQHHQNQLFQPQQQLTQQQLQLLNQFQQSQSDLQINLQLEPDTFEQDYLKEIEDQFNSNIEPMNYGTQSYSINIAPSSNRVGINISRAPRARPSNLLSTSQSNQYLSQSTINRNQQMIRSSQTPREFNQFQIDQRQLNSLNTKSKAFNKKAFYVSCQTLKLRKLVTFLELGLDDGQLMNYKVEDLILAIQSKLLNDEQIKYTAAYTQLTSNESLQVLSEDTPLDTLEFNNNTTIAIIPHRKVISSETQISKTKIKNPNRPLLKGDKMKINPSLLDLSFMSDLQLSKVDDFQVSTEFGNLIFLKPVDLRRVEIDRVIVFAQDEICFYPEDDGYVTPPMGQGMNVQCQITFLNFGSGQQEMQELKQNDSQAFEEKVKEWTDSLDMEIIEFTSDKLVVQVVGV